MRESLEKKKFRECIESENLELKGKVLSTIISIHGQEYSNFGMHKLATSEKKIKKDEIILK